MHMTTKRGSRFPDCVLSALNPENGTEKVKTNARKCLKT